MGVNDTRLIYTPLFYRLYYQIHYFFGTVGFIACAYVISHYHHVCPGVDSLDYSIVYAVIVYYPLHIHIVCNNHTAKTETLAQESGQNLVRQCRGIIGVDIADIEAKKNELTDTE